MSMWYWLAKALIAGPQMGMDIVGELMNEEPLYYLALAITNFQGRAGEAFPWLKRNYPQGYDFANMASAYAVDRTEGRLLNSAPRLYHLARAIRPPDARQLDSAITQLAPQQDEVYYLAIAVSNHAGKRDWALMELAER